MPATMPVETPTRTTGLITESYAVFRELLPNAHLAQQAMAEAARRVDEALVTTDPRPVTVQRGSYQVSGEWETRYHSWAVVLLPQASACEVGEFTAQDLSGGQAWGRCREVAGMTFERHYLRADPEGRGFTAWKRVA